MMWDRSDQSNSYYGNIGYNIDAVHGSSGFKREFNQEEKYESDRLMENSENCCLKDGRDSDLKMDRNPNMDNNYFESSCGVKSQRQSCITEEILHLGASSDFSNIADLSSIDDDCNIERNKKMDIYSDMENHSVNFNVADVLPADSSKNPVTFTFSNISRFQALNAEASTDNLSQHFSVSQDKKVKVESVNGKCMLYSDEKMNEETCLLHKENDNADGKNLSYRKCDQSEQTKIIEVNNIKKEIKEPVHRGIEVESNLHMECYDETSHSSDSDDGSETKASDGDQVDLPQLKRRIWNPTKKLQGKRKYFDSGFRYGGDNISSDDTCNTYSDMSNEQKEPRRNRRKQLRPDKSSVQPSWADSNKPVIEFENSKMFLKFRQEQNAFRCKECNISFCSQGTLMAHILSHRCRNPTTEKQDYFTMETDISKGKLNSEIPRSENKDSAISEVKISVDELLRTHVKEDEKMVKCKYCFVTFPSKKGVQRHITFKHKDKLINQGNDLDLKNEFVCVLCSKKLKSKYSLIKHWQIHSESKDYKCSLCYKEFAYKQSLDMHKRSHEVIREHESQGHKLQMESAAQGHTVMGNSQGINRAEDEEGSFDKSSVNKELSDLSKSLCEKLESEIYLTKVDDSGKAFFHCVNCMKGFIDKSGLIGHLGAGCSDKRHKPQKCPVCDKILKTSVADHIRIHTGERPYECPECGKMFKRGYHLQIHQQTAHSDEKPWICDEPGCGKAFKRKDKLQCHKRTHSSEKPYTCTECGNSYKQSHHLSRHKKRTHNRMAVIPSTSETKVELGKTSNFIDFSQMDKIIRDTISTPDKEKAIKQEDETYKDSDESWDMSKQIAETISSLKDKED